MIIKFLYKLCLPYAKLLISIMEKLVYWPYFNFPFGKTSNASAKQYLLIWDKAKEVKYPVIDKIEKDYGFSIDKKWFHNLALQTQVVIKKSDICYQHGRLLYTILSHCIKHNPNKNINILETGTALGFSSLCMAKALNDAGQCGKIITFDVLPHNIRMFWNCIADEKGPQTRAELLHDYDSLVEKYIIFHQGDTKIELKKVNIPRVHFAFLDCSHTYEYVLNEFDSIKDKQKKGDIIFFDDYTPNLFQGVVKAVDHICAEFNYLKRVITLNDKRGYVIANKN